jgi:hypothetical protein
MHFTRPLSVCRDLFRRPGPTDRQRPVRISQTDGLRRLLLPFSQRADALL